MIAKIDPKIQTEQRTKNEAGLTEHISFYFRDLEVNRVYDDIGKYPEIKSLISDWQLRYSHYMWFFTVGNNDYVAVINNNETCQKDKDDLRYWFENIMIED